MKYLEIFEAISKSQQLTSDRALAAHLGITQNTLIKHKKSKSSLTPQQVARMLHKHSIAQTADALRTAIRPIVEHYPIEKCESKHGANWEILPTANKTSRNCKIRDYLSKSTGIYFFYDSLGQVIYNGKTESQTLWKEMNQAFNRSREQHKIYRVAHPTTGTGFEPAWKVPRQPIKRSVYICDVANYFSAYDVSDELIGIVEALFIRSICNDLSNVKIEKLKPVT